MLAAIKHGLRNLFNFQGRDARQAFWFYVLFIYLITMGIGMVISVPMSMQATMAGIQQGMAQAGNANREASQAAAQAAIAASMSRYMPLMVWATFVSAIIMLVGLAASLVRRLHDADLSGYWALLPLSLQAINVALIPTQLGKLEEMLTAQFTDPFAGLKIYEGAFGIGTAAGWAAIIAVVVMGTRKSSPGSNRYGETPFIA
jgi:uncharacterized membrane protein YhaH (DUF805 family)